MSTIKSVIIGTGNYLPSRVVKNDAFLKNKFFDISFTAGFLILIYSYPIYLFSLTRAYSF